MTAYIKESLAVFSCWGGDPDWHSLCSASSGSFQHEVGAASRVAADSGCGQHHRAHRGRSRPDQGTGRGGGGELPLSHRSVVLMLTLPSHLHTHGHPSERRNKTARPARWGGYQMVLWPSMCWFFSLPLGVIQLKSNNQNNQIELTYIHPDAVYYQRTGLSWLLWMQRNGPKLGMLSRNWHYS